MKTGSDSFGGKFKLLVPQLDSIRSRVYWQHGMTQKEGDGGYYCSVPLLHSADVSFVCSVPDCSENRHRGTAVLTHSFPGCPLTVSPWPGASLWIGTARGWRPSAVQAAWDSSSRELRRCLLGAQLLLHQVIEAEWQADQDVYQDSYGQELKENNMKCT